MRKVLLATTALVAMSVTAAQADVSISGEGVFEVYTPDEGAQSFSTDGAITVKGTTTTDSGLTFTALSQLKFEGVNVDSDADAMAAVTTSGNYTSNNDSYIDIAGDFGNVRMGNTDDALDLNDGALAANMDLEGTGGPSKGSIHGTAVGGDSQNISWTSPSMSGAKIYVSVDADGANTAYGANYSMGMINLVAQSDETSTVIGASLSANGFTVGMGSKAKDASPTRSKIKSTDIGLSYTMGDIKFVATSAQGKESNNVNRTDKYKNVGVAYTIAPGVTAMIESGDYERSDVAGAAGKSSATWAALSVKF
jgi:hypothetical protein